MARGLLFALRMLKTIYLLFALQTSASTRHYELRLVDSDCGKVTSKSKDSADEIHACTRDGKLELDWYTREGTHEVRNQSTLVPNGQPFSITADGAKLSVTIQ